MVFKRDDASFKFRHPHNNEMEVFLWIDYINSENDFKIFYAMTKEGFSSWGMNADGDFLQPSTFIYIDHRFAYAHCDGVYHDIDDSDEEDSFIRDKVIEVIQQHYISQKIEEIMLNE